MPRRKRQANTFNLSFLDIMSCGFGAVVLVFLIIDHSIEIQIQSVNAEVLSKSTCLRKTFEKAKKVSCAYAMRLAVPILRLSKRRARRVVTEELDRLEALIASLKNRMSVKPPISRR